MKNETISVPLSLRTITSIVALSFGVLAGCSGEASGEAQEPIAEDVSERSADPQQPPQIDPRAGDPSPAIMQWSCTYSREKGWECFCSANCRF